MSLSLRRAWIEIVSDITKMFTSLSLSLRRAWIEIMALDKAISPRRVALLTESVD